MEARASRALLEHAYRLGIRHFDTAPQYGHGQSENLLGEVFGSARDVTIATKVGIARPDGSPSFASVLKRRTLRRALSFFPTFKKRLLVRTGAVAAAGPANPTTRNVLLADRVRRELEESLRRLRRSKIDLYLVHEPDQYLLDAALQSVFEDCVRQGLVSAYGLAYGRVASSAQVLGEVVQGAFAEGDDITACLRVYHGVLRSNPEQSVQRLASAMRRYPLSGFIASASEPHQLTNLVRQLQERNATVVGERL
jgi:aryl-alcohol dehydrogenase-like predicted oxidoreductase